MQSLNLSKNSPLRLGTRGSPLALVQAHHVKDLIRNAHNLPEEAVEIIVMKTTGDRFTDRPLSAIGGKGLFTKELELGLFQQDIDLAVHSMKDVATILPDGLELCAILEREDVRDAFISHKYQSLAELPPGAVVGTSSLRRKAQILNIRPDLQIVEFRGVVETRLQKLEDGVAEASFLAVAGLKRLGRTDLLGKIAQEISIDDMLPAAAQAAIGIEIRQDHEALREFLAPLNHVPTEKAINAERAFLRRLDGSCRTPIAAYCDKNVLRGEVLALDGQRVLKGEWWGESPVVLGERGAQDLLEQGAADLLKAL